MTTSSFGITDEACDRLVQAVLLAIANKNGALVDELNPDILKHQTLRRSLVQAAYELGKISAQTANQISQRGHPMSDTKHPAEALADWFENIVRSDEWSEWSESAITFLRRIPALEAERDAALKAARYECDIAGQAISDLGEMRAERDALRAEVEALRAEVERERESRKAAQIQLEATQERANRAAMEAGIYEGKRLRAEIETLRADAERYRWLRDEAWGGNNHTGPHLVAYKPGLMPSSMMELAEKAADAAIDAAREAQR